MRRMWWGMNKRQRLDKRISYYCFIVSYSRFTKTLLLSRIMIQSHVSGNYISETYLYCTIYGSGLKNQKKNPIFNRNEFSVWWGFLLAVGRQRDLDRGNLSIFGWIFGLFWSDEHWHSFEQPCRQFWLLVWGFYLQVYGVQYMMTCWSEPWETPLTILSCGLEGVLKWIKTYISHASGENENIRAKLDTFICDQHCSELIGNERLF